MYHTLDCISVISSYVKFLCMKKKSTKKPCPFCCFRCKHSQFLITGCLSLESFCFYSIFFRLLCSNWMCIIVSNTLVFFSLIFYLTLDFTEDNQKVTTSIRNRFYGVLSFLFVLLGFLLCWLFFPQNCLDWGQFFFVCYFFLD